MHITQCQCKDYACIRIVENVQAGRMGLSTAGYCYSVYFFPSR